MTALDFFARWRVRIGYLLAAVVLWLARPTPRTIFGGALIGLLGLAIRAYAAGFLHKQKVLTTSGPYAFTRNPLYFGSSILALGAAVATHSWWCAGIVLIYFALVYSFAMRREENELRAQHGPAFDVYAAAVPLFFPKLTPWKKPGVEPGAFSFAQYQKNHEYEASLGFLLLLLALIVIGHVRGL